MVIKEVFKVTKLALENMNKEVCRLSPLVYNKENTEKPINGLIIQAEVNKKYQHYFRKGKSPDFIIQTPNSNNNLAVLEFKLAINPKKKIKRDFKKLIEFKNHPELIYIYSIEVLLGTKRFLENRKKDINT